MNYKHLTYTELIEYIEKLESEHLKTYTSLTEELNEERTLRKSYQDSTNHLHKKLIEYKVLVGDATRKEILIHTGTCEE